MSTLAQGYSSIVGEPLLRAECVHYGPSGVLRIGTREYGRRFASFLEEITHPVAVHHGVHEKVAFTSLSHFIIAMVV